MDYWRRLFLDMDGVVVGVYNSGAVIGKKRSSAWYTSRGQKTQGFQKEGPAGSSKIQARPKRENFHLDFLVLNFLFSLIRQRTRRRVPDPLDQGHASHVR